MMLAKAVLLMAATLFLGKRFQPFQVSAISMMKFLGMLISCLNMVIGHCLSVKAPLLE